MMDLLYNLAKKTPEENRSAEFRAVLDTYNKKVSFMDFGELEGIDID